MPDDLLTKLNDVGIHVPDLFAGLAGGVVRTLLDSRFKPVYTVISAVTGGITANYLADPFTAGFNKLFSAWFGGATLNENVSGFLVGLTAMTLCQVLIAKIRKWSGADANDGGGHAPP